MPKPFRRSACVAESNPLHWVCTENTNSAAFYRGSSLFIRILNGASTEMSTSAQAPAARTSHRTYDGNDGE